MRDVSLNPVRPFGHELTELTWLDDPAIAPTLVTLTSGATRVVVAPEIGGALAMRSGSRSSNAPCVAGRSQCSRPAGVDS